MFGDPRVVLLQVRCVTEKTDTYPQLVHSHSRVRILVEQFQKKVLQTRICALWNWNGSLPNVLIQLEDIRAREREGPKDHAVEGHTHGPEIVGFR